jgi:dihydrodipicolinate synthase/N-acetylneuraminate lyase
VEADGDSRIFDIRFTPNRVDFSVVAGRTASVVRLNQNAAAGWSSVLGPVVPDATSGMHAPLQPGQAGKFSFRFMPPGLYAGLAVAAAALMVSILGWRRVLPDR